MSINNQSRRSAVFIKELKNRFRCLISIDGKEELCYVPSSCRLSNFVDLTGRTVLVEQVAYPSGIKYALYVAETPKGQVLLNLAAANEIIENQLKRRYFSFLGSRKIVRREALIDGYKSDLFIQDTNTIVEIKTVLSFDSVAHFPTVSSQRSIDQLSRIIDLLDLGHNVCYMFVSLGPHVKKLCLDADLEYSELFDKCIRKGMICYGCALKTSEDETQIAFHIEIQTAREKIINHVGTR